MFRHTVVVMMLFVIGGELCIIKQESNHLARIGQGTFKEISEQSTLYPTQPDHIPLEDVYAEGKIRSMTNLVDRLEQGIRVWSPQNINDMKIQTLIPFPPEFEDDEEVEDTQDTKWNAMRLKLKSLKLSTYIVGVAPKAMHAESEKYQYFFVILKYAHLKAIQRSVGDQNTAEIAAEAFIDDPQFETIILDPIWKTNGNAVLESSAPVAAIPERHWGADYHVLSCWKFQSEPGVHRYISMLKHESETEHAHWFFVSALMFEDVHIPTRINYVGGYMSTPKMAEISVLNFMNLSLDFKNGVWSDSSLQPGTWDGVHSSISWKAEAPKNAIMASIDRIVASKEFHGPKDLTGVDISFYFAIGTRHMPCPISPDEHFFYLFHSIDYYWITVQVPDAKGAVHLVSIVHRYVDNIYHDTILETSGGDYAPEKQKTLNIVKQLFRRKSSKVMSKGNPLQ